MPEKRIGQCGSRTATFVFARLANDWRSFKDNIIMFQTRPFCRCIILLGICWFVKSHIHGVPPVLDYLWFDQISAAFRCFNQQAVSRPAPPTSQALQGTGAAPLFFDYHCRFLMIIATYSMHYKHTCIPPFDHKRGKSWHLLKTIVFFFGIPPSGTGKVAHSNSLSIKTSSSRSRLRHAAFT